MENNAPGPAIDLRTNLEDRYTKKRTGSHTVNVRILVILLIKHILFIPVPAVNPPSLTKLTLTGEGNVL